MIWQNNDDQVRKWIAKLKHNCNLLNVTVPLKDLLTHLGIQAVSFDSKPLSV